MTTPVQTTPYGAIFFSKVDRKTPDANRTRNRFDLQSSKSRSRDTSSGYEFKPRSIIGFTKKNQKDLSIVAWGEEGKLHARVK